MTIPALRTIVTPVEVDTREDRIEAMRVLAAGNTIITLLLGAILALQASFQASFFQSFVLLQRVIFDAEKFLKSDLPAPLSVRHSWSECLVNICC